MGKILGPYDLDDWYTMLALKNSINVLKNKSTTDNPLSKISLKKELKMFKKYITKGAA